MNKEKIGKNVYYASLIISVIILAITLFFVKIEDKEKLSCVRYMTCFYCFTGVISTGMIIREFFVEKFEKKKMIFKIIFTIATVVIGTVIYILFPSAKVCLGIFFVGLLLLMFVLVPSIPKDNNIVI